MRKTVSRFVILVVLLFACFLLSLTVGSVKLPLSTTVQTIIQRVIGGPEAGNFGMAETILFDLRLPRIFLAIVVGAMLSTAGVAFQGILRNPLADPYILGVSTGAALGAAVSILLSKYLSLLSNHWSIPLFAFAGSMLSLWLVMTLASHGGQRERETLILAGVVVQSLLGAFLSFLIASSGEQMQQIVFWMMGSLANKSWSHVAVLLPYLGLGIILLFLKHRELDIFALGERAAAHLGVNVERTKVLVLAIASFLTAAAVSAVGVIGFVGLVVPHCMRLIYGPNHKSLLLASVVGGGLFLLISDTIARTIIPSREIPIGVITAFVGAPFFGYLLKRSLRRG